MNPVWIFILFFFLLAPPIHGKEKVPALSPLPGKTSLGPGGIRINLEGGRVLWWLSDGTLRVQEPGGAVSVQVDLKTKPRSTGGAEAMGLDVEESDLGGRLGDKNYLKGKKNPKGRKLDPNALAAAPEEAAKGQRRTRTVAGVVMAETKYPNGSYQLEFNWGDGKETVFFDRRNTLMWMELQEGSAPLKPTIRHWSDGSFTRTYRGQGGELSYNYDALSKSYRLVFSNARGETVAEAGCDGGPCSLD